MLAKGGGLEGGWWHGRMDGWMERRLRMRIWLYYGLVCVETFFFFIEDEWGFASDFSSGKLDTAFDSCNCSFGAWMVM